MTFAEIKAEVRRRINELTSTFWDDDEIVAAIHEGEDEFADACEWYERWQTIDVLRDRPYYDLRTVIRFEFLMAGPVFNETTNRWLIPYHHHDFSSGDTRWEERLAEGEFYTMRGIWWLGVFPRKDAELGSLKQYFVALPRHMENDDDEPGFHRTFHYGLVEYAVADLLSQDAETDLTLEVWANYKVYEEGLSKYMKNRAYIPTIHAYSPGPL